MIDGPDYLIQVESHADEDWKEETLKIVEQLALERETFTTDDVWEMLSELDVSTHEPRAMGAIMTIAKKMRLISPTTHHILSTRPSCHSRPIRVWKSELK